MKEEILKERIRHGATCAVAIVFLEFKKSKQNLEEFKTVLEDDTIPGTAISRWLNRQNIIIKPCSITRHRRKECRCGD